MQRIKIVRLSLWLLSDCRKSKRNSDGGSKGCWPKKRVCMYDCA